MPKDPIEQLQDSQSDQTKILRELRDDVVRMLALVERWADDNDKQDKRLEDIERRLDSLEETRTESRTALRVTWGFVVALASCVGWLLSR